MKKLAVLCLGLVLSGAVQAAVAVGDTPPDSLGKDKGGKEVRISDQHGKVVVVTFWASWCGYCRKELPILAGLQQAAGKDRVEVVAVNYMDDNDVFRAIRRQLKDVEMTLTRDASGAIGKAFGVGGIPHLFIIDRQGKVAYELTGYGEESLDGILDEVNRQLAQPPVATGS